MALFLFHKHVIKSTFLLIMPFIGHFRAFHVFPNYFHMSWDKATYFFVWMWIENGAFSSYDEAARPLWITEIFLL